MVQRKGVFTISLDFELMWGVRDHRTIETYGRNIACVHEIVPELLRLFRQYGVHCSWATVGLLFGRSPEDAQHFVPGILPAYENAALDPYPVLKNGALENSYWFAPELIAQIAATEGQEIGTHTFSHYYTLEKGADLASFRADIEAAQQIAARDGRKLLTIVFPRNQYDERYLGVCRELGIVAYRGTEDHWIYRSRSRADEKGARRLMRLADTYFNISGHHTAVVTKGNEGLLNIPASRFLRPFHPRLKPLEGLRLHRIRASMEHAARQGEIFHLWWHPHNFGSHTQENFEFLEKILRCYARLNEAGQMSSMTMAEISGNAGI